MKRQTGFTLVELMIVLAVMGVLAAIAAPSYEAVMNGQRVSSVHNQLVSAMSLARSESFKRNINVRVEALTVGADTEWVNGWQVIVAGEAQPLRVFPPSRGNVTLVEANDLTTVTFTGRAGAGTVAGFDVCGNTGARGTQIWVNAVGRVSSGEIAACP